MKELLMLEKYEVPDYVKAVVRNEIQPFTDKIKELEAKLDEFQDKIMNKKDLSAFLGISNSTIIRFMKEEKLRYYRAKGKVFFKKSEVLEDMKKW